ncbi:diguanylate cyclase domain-containing protein [Andreprevotia chitinilytica]|uniref:diguanylate cyclase domain-containing protein n=1 Tax=Andreprevotia chitinilytica TaxID=396808 RepID=UPI0006896B82|nr:diguanylate cyclase [Andreprevotia chitinilytica]
MKRQSWPELVALAVLYALAQWGTRYIAPPDHYSSLIAPAAGVALAGMLLIGPRCWPVIAATAWLLPAMQGLPPLAVLQLTVIATVQPLLVASLLPGFAPDGELRVRDGMRLVATGPLLGAGLAAICGCIVLRLFKPELIGAGFDQWLLWWLGDALGMLAIVPMSLALRAERQSIRANWVIELTLVVAVAAASSILIYRRIDLGFADLQFLLFPLIIWSALRLGHIGNGWVVLTTGAVAAVTVNARGYVSIVELSILLLLVSVAVTGLLLAASSREEAKASKAAKLAAQVFDNASEGIVITDASANIVAVNPAFSRITGFPAAKAIGRVSRIFDTHGKVREFNQDVLTQLDIHGMWQGETLDRRKNGDIYSAWLSISAVRDDYGDISNYVGVFSDYTSRKEAEQRLLFMASHDPLTGLHNRAAMNDALVRAVQRAEQENRQLALFFIDLDGFKPINDTLGHDVGDELLKVIALRLNNGLKEGDVIARLGGDEFTVLVENVRYDDELASIAQRMLTDLAQPVVLRDQPLSVSASIGIGRYPQTAHDPVELLKHADLAMYQAKQGGKNNFCFYQPPRSVPPLAQQSSDVAMKRMAAAPAQQSLDSPG